MFWCWMGRRKRTYIQRGTQETHQSKESNQETKEKMMTVYAIKTDRGYYRKGYSGQFTNDIKDAYTYKILENAETKAEKVWQKHRRLSYIELVTVEYTPVVTATKTLYRIGL